jgi:hypothetical protein
VYDIIPLGSPGVRDVGGGVSVAMTGQGCRGPLSETAKADRPMWGQAGDNSETAKADRPSGGQTVTDTGAGPQMLRVSLRGVPPTPTSIL